MAFSAVQPWTLDVFSAFTSLTELRIGLFSMSLYSSMRAIYDTEIQYFIPSVDDDREPHGSVLHLMTCKHIQTAHTKKKTNRLMGSMQACKSFSSWRYMGL